MQTEIIKIDEKNRSEVVEKAARILQNGGLVVFPTETVYGLGASIEKEEALKKIFIAKGRPSNNPLIVHVSKKEQLAELTDNISELEQKLIDSFWPGPLTLILKKQNNISSILSAGLSTIAVRMPSNQTAQEILNKTGVPIAAPSANISGRPSGTTGADTYRDLLGKVDLIIDEGQSNIGLESTVLKVEGSEVFILRAGAITKEMIEKVIAPAAVSFTKDENKLQSSPGTQHKHYSPSAKLEIIDDVGGGAILSRAEALKNSGMRVGVLTTKQNEKYFTNYENIFSLGDQNNLEQIAQNLYSALRFFDTHQVDVILCPSFKEEGLGVAIMDRLKRAAME
jgi:L-threonylcarbamoyladenylate synthase